MQDAPPTKRRCQLLSPLPPQDVQGFQGLSFSREPARTEMRHFHVKPISAFAINSNLLINSPHALKGLFGGG